MGPNPNMCLGVKSSSCMTKPVRTSIRLRADETIVQIYACLYLFAIYTSSKNLHISRVTKPSFFSSIPQGVTDIEGIYKGTAGLDNSDSYSWLDESGWNRTKIRSTAFASEPGFNEPLTHVDQVSFWEDTIMFEIGSNPYLFNWRLCVRDTIGVCSALKLRPILHAQTLVYYKVRLPFSPDTVTYGRHFVHMQSGPKHHVFSAPEYHQRSADGEVMVNPLSWRDFEMDGIKSEHIHVSLLEPTFAVVRDGICYEYDEIIGSLKPSPCEPGSRPIIFNQQGADDPWIGFAEMDGMLTDYDSQPIGGFTKLIDQVVGLSSVVLIDSDCHDPYLDDDSFIVNVHGLEWYHVVASGVVTLDRVLGLRYITRHKTAPPLMQWVSSMRDADEECYIGARIAGLEAITSAQASDKMVVYQTVSGEYFRYMFSEEGVEHEPITLNWIEEVKIDYEAIEYPVPTQGFGSNEIIIDVEDDSLEKLYMIAERIGPFPCNVRIRYDSNGLMLAHGDGVKRDLIDRGLKQFSDRFFIKHTGYVEYNLQTLKDIPPHMLYTYGRMLHLAIVMLGTHMPIRMPVAFLVALLGREPSTAELEYLVRLAQPELFEQMQELESNPAALADAGYDTYQKFLQNLVGYDCLDDDSNLLARSISEALAGGFSDYVGIPYLISMNLATLGYYLSGDLVIDREQFIDQLTFPQRDSGEPIPEFILEACDTLERFVHNLIRTEPEEKLQGLLKNWSGTTVLGEGLFTIAVRAEGDGIDFHTCFRSLDVPLCMLDSTDLCADLTTPIDSISDRPVLVRVDSDPSDSEEYDAYNDSSERPSLQNLLDQYIIRANLGSIVRDHNDSPDDHEADIG